MSSIPTVSVVVPVYNAETTLLLLVDRLAATLGPAGLEYEVVLVNDGSADGSWRLIEELAAADPRTRGLNLMRNYGQHNALLAGVRAARGERIVTIDDDLQNPPEEIPILLAELDCGFDVVYGSADEPHYGLFRGVATRVTKWALRGMIGPAAADVSAFRSFRGELVRGFDDFGGPYVSLDVLLSWGTQRFGSVRVAHEPPAGGHSRYNFGRLATHALNVLTGFSTLPLRIASAIGLLFTLFGVFVLVLVVTLYLINGAVVPGFAFLSSVIAIFSGVQLLSLGIIGEYLARVHMRAMDRPPYTVRNEVGGRNPPDTSPSQIENAAGVGQRPLP